MPMAPVRSARAGLLCVSHGITFGVGVESLWDRFEKHLQVALGVGHGPVLGVSGVDGETILDFLPAARNTFRTLWGWSGVGPGCVWGRSG